MLLPEIFLSAYAEFDSIWPIAELSNVKIQCTESDPEEVKSYFMKEVEKNWDEFWKDSVRYDENEDDAEEFKDFNELPITCSISEDVVFVSVGHIPSIDIWEMDFEYNSKFLEKALKSTKKNFSDIKCSGFIITDYSNESGGEYFCEEVSENGKISLPTKKAYPEIGEVLLAALSETSDGIDPRAWAFYGSHSDEIWDFISDESSNEDLKELFECFKVYSDWVKPEYFEKLAEISEDGEDFDGDDTDLPDGYMEALEASVEAEEYENELADEGILPNAPRPGKYYVLSPQTFPRIVYKANEGDERAIAIIAKIEASNE